MATGDTSKPQFATGTSTSDGDYATPLAAAVAGKKIRVKAVSITALTTAGLVTLKTATTGTVIYQANVAIGTPFVAYCPDGLCETLSGEGLTPNNGSGVDSFINCTFVTVE